MLTMIIPNTLRQEIRKLEQEMAGYDESLDRAATDKEHVQQQYDSLCAQQGWRERYCAGWFGGDKVLVQNLKKLAGEIELYNAKSEQLRATIASTDKEVDKVIKTYLQNSDPAYQQLSAVLSQIGETKAATDSYVVTIEEALSEIDDAQGMETLDLISSNKGIALMSYFENSEAAEAIERVKATTRPFQDHLQQYNGFLKGLALPELGHFEIGDGMDLTFDLVFDGFDFLSLYTLSRLDDAETELKELHFKVAAVQGKMDEQYQKAEAAVKSYVRAVKETSRGEAR